MTISISNAPAEALLRERRRAAELAAAEREQRARETARTVFSRFIILTLCLALVLSTLAFGTVHSWSLGVFQAGAALVVVFWAADAWRTRRLRLSRSALQLSLLGLFAYGLVQLLPLGTPAAVPDPAVSAEAVRSLSLDPYATRFVLVQLGALVVYFAAALSFIDSPGRLRLVTRVVIVFGFLLAIFGLIQSFVSPLRIYGIRELKQAVGFGPFVNRHHFAAYMEMAAALPLGLLFAGSIDRDRRVLYGFAALLMGAALVMTNSRGGMLALGAEVVFLVVVSGLVRRPAHGEGGEDVDTHSRSRGLLLRALAGVGVIAVLLGLALSLGGDAALNRLLGTVNSDDPTTGRLHFWRGTLGIIRDHLWTGTGLGSFSVAYPRYDTGNGSLYRLEQAHNDYLQIVSDAGLVGLALGLLFVVLLFRAGLRRMQSESSFRRGVALGALAGCFAALVHSFFDFPLHTTANGLLFLTLAALAALDGRVEHSHRKRRRSSRGGGRERAAPAPKSEPDAHTATSGI